MLPRLLVVPFVVLLTAMAPGLAAAEPDGKVEGWLEAKGERIPLTHIFAAMENDVLERGDNENMVILVSDKPLPPELRKAAKDYTLWAGEQARAGEMQGVVIVIDPETNVWSRGHRLSKAHGLTFYSHTSTSPEGRLLHFERAEAGKTEIAGKVSMREPMRGIDESDGPWQIEAEFRTPVVQQDPITAKLTGAEALKSPQYKAVMAFLQASKRKDVEQIKKTMDSNSQATFAQMIAELGRADALKMMAEMAAESLKMKDAEVVVRGSTAEVKLKRTGKNSREEVAMKVALDGGTWKMTR
jgi:hypothetical protein